MDSLQNSVSLYPSLELWRDSSMLKTKKLIATLGISLTDAEQAFKFLNGLIKKDFRRKFADACNKLKLPDVCIDSFSYNQDYKYQFDAFDIANVMAAVLSSPKNLKDLVFKVETTTPVPADHQPSFSQEQNFWSVFHQLLDR